MGVSKNDGTPKSSILIGFSIRKHPFWGTPIFGNTHINIRLLMVIIVIIIFRLGQSNLHQEFSPDSERNSHPGKNKLSGNLPPSKEIKCYPPVFFSITMKPLFLESQANLWSLQHQDSNKQPSTKNYTQIHGKTHLHQPTASTFGSSCSSTFWSSRCLDSGKAKRQRFSKYLPRTEGWKGRKPTKPTEWEKWRCFWKRHILSSNIWKRYVLSF